MSISRRLCGGPWIFALVGLALLVPGWRSVRAQSPNPADPLLVLGAASLSEVLAGLGEVWESEGGRPLAFSFAATSRIAQQAARGGGADIFLSADDHWMGWLDENGVIDGTSRRLFGNSLVVVVPAAAGTAPQEPADLAHLGGRLALAGENVPAGRYATEALVALGAWEGVADRVVRGGSVRDALEWVARGEVDAAVVYLTDALVEPRVRVALPLEGPGVPRPYYSAAVLAGSVRTSDARAFLDFLSSPSASDVAERYGFEGATTDAGEMQDVPPTSSSLPNVYSAVGLSALVGLLAVLLGLGPAVAVGWVLARKPFPGKAMVTTLVLAPLVMPPVVTGFLLLALLGRGGPLGGVLGVVGVAVPFTFAAPVLAALVVGFPLYVVVVRGAFEAVDPRYEEVSWTLGVPPRQTFWRVAVPLALPGIVAGAVLAFARALGEFGATVVLAGNIEGQTRTIALAVYTLLEAPGGESRMWWLVGASVALSLAALFGYEALTRHQRSRLEEHRG